MGKRPVAVVAAVLVAAACTDGGNGGREGMRRSADRALDIAGMPARLAVLQGAGGETPWLAAGDSPDGQGGGVATVWRSVDGLSWDRLALADGGGAIVRGAARHDEVLVLVGDRGGGGRRTPAAWVARGGAEPTPVSAGFPSGGATVLVRQVVDGAGGSGGFLAQGTVDGRVALWRSHDGASWERVEGLAEVFGPTSAVAQLAATVSGVVAVGAEGATPAAWWSTDGLHWSRASVVETRPGRITAVATGPEGILATGSAVATDAGPAGAPVRRQVPAVWRSTDGQSWEAVAATFDSADGGPELKALVRTDTAFVVTGGGAQARRLWSSADGRAWTESELPAAARVATGLDFALLASNGADVLVGSSVEVSPPRLLLHRRGRWHDASVATPLSPPRPVAVETGVMATTEGFVLWANLLDAGPNFAEEGGGARVWLSSDGRRWQPVQGSAAFDLSFVLAMAVDASGGLVAVGTEPSVAPIVSRGRPHAKTWVSTTGEAWLPDDAPFREEQNAQTLSGVAARGERVVAVGTRTISAIDFDAVFWLRDRAGPWRRVEGVPSSVGHGAEGASRVCAGEPGWVALGTGSHTPVAWSSADGEQWDPVDDPGLAAAGEDIRSCLGVGGRFLAVGSARDPSGHRSAGAWTSTDGRSWSPSASPSLRADLDLRIDHVAADGNQVVAVGVEGQGANRPVALWRSSDCGASWDRARVDGGLFGFARERAVTGVAVHDGMVALSGVTDGQVSVWTVPLVELPGAGGDRRDCRS